MTKLDRAPPLKKPTNYSTTFGEFIGVGPNGNLWVDGADNLGPDRAGCLDDLAPSEMPSARTTRMSRSCSPTNPTMASPSATS